MAFAPQFNYSPPGSAPLQSPQLILPGKAPRTPDSARSLLHEACSSQGVCTCPVGSSVPYLTRVANIAESVYSQAAMTPAGMGVEPSAFYPLSAAGQSLGLDRQATELWKGLQQQSPVMYPFDPMLAVHPYSSFYGNLDLNSAARRKNATRETTSALKAWLYEHRKNPYPTKGEKIMLAIITKMTLTQVSTWFANARRRLKKESKLSWSNKDKDFDDSDIDCDELNDKSMDESSDEISKSRIGSTSSTLSRDQDDEEDIKVTSDLSDISDTEVETNQPPCSRLNPELEVNGLLNQKCSNPPSASTTPSVQSQQNNSNQINSKPKIWSIAEIMNNDSSKAKNSSTPLPNIIIPHQSDKTDSIQNSRNFYSGLCLIDRETLTQSVTSSRPPVVRNLAETALNLTVIEKKTPECSPKEKQSTLPKSC